MKVERKLERDHRTLSERQDFYEGAQTEGKSFREEQRTSFAVDL